MVLFEVLHKFVIPGQLLITNVTVKAVEFFLFRTARFVNLNLGFVIFIHRQIKILEIVLRLFLVD